MEFSDFITPNDGCCEVLLCVIYCTGVGKLLLFIA